MNWGSGATPRRRHSSHPGLPPCPIANLSFPSRSSLRAPPPRIGGPNLPTRTGAPYINTRSAAVAGRAATAAGAGGVEPRALPAILREDLESETRGQLSDKIGQLTATLDAEVDQVVFKSHFERKSGTTEPTFHSIGGRQPLVGLNSKNYYGSGGIVILL